MTSDDGDGQEPPPEAPPPEAPAGEAGLEAMPVVAPAAASTDDLREAVGVARLDEKAARKAEKEAAKAAGREQVRLQKEAKAKAKAEADASKRAELGDEAPDDDDLDDDAPKKKSKTLLVVALALVAGGVIATFVLLGRSNSERYLFTCTPKQIVAQQGRSFPPWGASGLSGAQWKAIPIPPGAECESRETDDASELAGWYLEALQEQAQLKLTGREVNEVDEAERELQQALLLARDPERRDQRHELERLLGDVEYWRGMARVKESAQALEDAAKKFEDAADKRPRNPTDAAAWAKFLRETAAAVLAGPGGVKPDTVGQTDASGTTRPDIPTGVALPVEEPSQAPDAGVAPLAIDAGLPQGGVLL